MMVSLRLELKGTDYHFGTTEKEVRQSLASYLPAIQKRLLFSNETSWREALVDDCSGEAIGTLELMIVKGL